MHVVQELIAAAGASRVEWGLFLSTFVLIFVAELPDKTALAALLLATSHHPLAVFIGAAGAFVIQSLVAVAFGSVFSLLPERPVHIVAGLLFFVFAALMWRRRQEEDQSDGEAAEAGRFWKSTMASFLVIFLAEWGDLTQLATATLAAKYRAPVTIFASATLSLWLVTAIGVFVGSKLKHLVNAVVLQKLAAVVMAGVGVYLCASIFS